MKKREIRIIIASILVSLILVSPTFRASPQESQALSKTGRFATLQQKLSDYGFPVELAIPPYQNRYGIRPYGLVNTKDDKVWLNPIVFDLGNALPTLVHETVHVAQLCKGDRASFELLNLEIEAPKITHPYFMRYHNLQREIEAEAYTVQVQPNSYELALGLLTENCPVPAN